jgi:hypothetical protein
MRKSGAAAERAPAEGDARVATFRRALDGLIDSLEATVRIGRWTGAEGVPEPLSASASQLLARLGSANRLAAGRFSGSIADAARVQAIAAAMRRLDAAYVAYCQGRDRDLAAATLDAEILQVKGAV